VPDLLVVVDLSVLADTQVVLDMQVVKVLSVVEDLLDHLDIPVVKVFLDLDLLVVPAVLDKLDFLEA
jgi:hypothetical protein